MQILTNPSDSVSAEKESWQQTMRTAIRDVKTLRKQLNLPQDPSSAGAAASFGLFAPQPFVDRIKPGDVSDPLLLQLLPTAAEDQSPTHFSVDPLAESDARLTTGVLKKYSGRALMIVTGACAIHCRYCFRRHFPYSNNSAGGNDLEGALATIAADPSIEEVILSGGDPLTVVDQKLSTLLASLEAIPHLRRVRIHTRLPIMIPARVNEALVDMLRQSSMEKVVVIHANHANEFDANVTDALGRLRSTGATLLNQTVLLKGINDDSQTLIELSKRLLSVGVMPYYLHQLDQVIGAAHFEVPIETGKRLITEMRAALPGFAVPRYVRETAGEPNKTVLA